MEINYELVLAVELLDFLCAPASHSNENLQQVHCVLHAGSLITPRSPPNKTFFKSTRTQAESKYTILASGPVGLQLGH